MFLDGLKFALGIIAGISIFSGMFVLALVGAELFALWRRERGRRLYPARTRVSQIRERVVFCFHFHTSDWIRMRDETRYPR